MPTAHHAPLATRNLHSKLGGEWSSSRTPPYCLFSQITLGANYYCWGFQKQMWDRVYGTRYLLGIKSVQGDKGRRIVQKKKSNWDIGLTDLAKLVESSGINLLIIVFEVKMVRSLYLCLTQPPEGCSQKGVAHIRPYSSNEAKPGEADSFLVTSFPQVWHHVFSFQSNLGITSSCLPHLFYLDAI